MRRVSEMSRLGAHIFKSPFVFSLVLALALLYPLQGHAVLTAKANHDHIKIDFLYHGSTVSVSGISDPGVDLVIKITSPEKHESLKEKGKVAGTVWMNVADLKIDKVPGLYFLSSTKKLEDLISPEAMSTDVLGYPALKDHLTTEPSLGEAEKTKWFGEFIKYKESGKLYSTWEGQIKLTPEGDHQKYYTLMQWPYQAGPGKYTVSVYAVKDKKIVERAQSEVLVEQVGIVKEFSEMASKNPALYGMISIFSALLAGFGVGMIFRKGGGSH